MGDAFANVSNGDAAPGTGPRDDVEGVKPAAEGYSLVAGRKAQCALASFLEPTGNGFSGAVTCRSAEPDCLGCPSTIWFDSASSARSQFKDAGDRGANSTKPVHRGAKLEKAFAKNAYRFFAVIGVRGNWHKARELPGGSGAVGDDLVVVTLLVDEIPAISSAADHGCKLPDDFFASAQIMERRIEFAVTPIECDLQTARHLSVVDEVLKNSFSQRRRCIVKYAVSRALLRPLSSGGKNWQQPERGALACAVSPEQQR